MRAHARLPFSALVAFGALACDSGPGEILTTQTPEEASTLWAESYCDWLSECGRPQQACGGGFCRTQIVKVSYATCYEPTQIALEHRLGCVPLEPDQAMGLNGCFAVLRTEGCFTREQAVEADRTNMPLQMPEACDRVNLRLNIDWLGRSCDER